MAVWSQISTSDLVGAIRLDAEFWQPSYLEKEKAIRINEHMPLGSLVSTFKKGIFYILAREYAATGVPFYRSSNVGAVLPKEEGIAFITERKHQDEYKTALVNGDLMIVKTGRSGASVVLQEKCNVSQDVIAVKVRRERVNPYYLAVYLNTCFGSSEMNRWFQGQVQPHLSLEDARRIWVPLIESSQQQEIEKLVLGSAQAKAASQLALTTAQQLLESKLGLDKLSFKKPIGYVAHLSETIIGSRFDADYFQTPYRQIHNHLDSLQTARLIQLVEIVKGIEVGSKAYSASGIPFLRVSNIKERGIELGASDKYVSDELYKTLSAYHPQIGELLLTKDGTAGVCFAVDEHVNGIISGGVVRLLPRSDEIPNEYLALVINSKICRMQVEQDCSGALILHWKPSSIRKIRIPLLAKAKMQEIAHLVSRSKQAKRESETLLEQAKNRVEQLIEQAMQS